MGSAMDVAIGVLGVAMAISPMLQGARASTCHTGGEAGQPGVDWAGGAGGGNCPLMCSETAAPLLDPCHSPDSPTLIVFPGECTAPYHQQVVRCLRTAPG